MSGIIRQITAARGLRRDVSTDSILGIEPDPRNENVCFFGHDSGHAGNTDKNRGIVRVDNSNGVSQEFVQRLNIDRYEERSGSYTLRAVYDPIDSASSYLIASSHTGDITERCGRVSPYRVGHGEPFSRYRRGL